MRRIPGKWLALAAVFAGLVFGAQILAGSAARDWPQFRGVDRDGRSGEQGLLDAWPDAGPEEVWRKPIGSGFSGISIVGDRLYTMYAGPHEGKRAQFAAAFDTATGAEVWRTPVGEQFDNEFGNGPRSTPTVDGGRVYVLSARGDLAALSAEDGAEKWKVSLIEKFGAQQPYHGYSGSALVDGDLLIVESGGADGESYVALDKATGDVRWTFGDAANGPGYNSPVRVTRNGKSRYIYITGSAMHCLNEKGEQVWSHDWPRGETHAVPVIVPPNRIFASGAEGIGGALFEVAEVDGIEAVGEVWRTNFMRSHFNASVLHGDHLYGFDNATLKCISVADGSMAWAKRGLGKGSLIVADDKLFVLSDQGRLLLVAATPDGYVEKGSVQALEGKSWTAPALSGGRIYLRNLTEMVAYDLKG